MERILDFVRRKPWQVAGLVVVILGGALVVGAGDNFLLRSIGLLLLFGGILVQRRARTQSAAADAAFVSQTKAGVKAGVLGALIVIIVLAAAVFSGVPEPYVTIVGVGGVILVFAAIYGVQALTRRKGDR